jgi:hypothetical protein
LQRSRYVEAVRRSLKPGGHIVVATFGPHEWVRGRPKASPSPLSRWG